MSEWGPQVDRLRSRAAALAAPLSRQARGGTTLGQERAILRLLGVDGVDREGRPLAASVVERICSRPGALARGAALPFGAALAATGRSVRELAVDVASGAVRLASDDESVAAAEPAAARAALAELAAAALARIDANRTAGRELRSVLGEAPLPWIGLTVAADESRAAAGEVRRAVGAGAGLVRVRVPAGWEFRRAMGHGARDERDGRGALTGGALTRGAMSRAARSKQLRRDQGAELQAGAETPPGSRRGLSVLREAADEAAAERGCYASLMTVTAALSAPEQAAVAALERIDFVEADAVREIAEGNVDPDRALADHSFAHRLHNRSGVRLVVGPGPLALGPDIEAGVPGTLAARAGRALALQALELELALADGITPGRIVLGAVPAWVPDDGGVRAVVVQSWLRAVVFPDHALVVEPSEELGHLELVGALAGIHAAGARRRAMLLLADMRTSRSANCVDTVRQVARVVDETAESTGGAGLRPAAEALALDTLATANAVLEEFAAEGWAAVLGGARAQTGVRLGAAGIIERAYDFDPLRLDPVTA